MGEQDPKRRCMGAAALLQQRRQAPAEPPELRAALDGIAGSTVEFIGGNLVHFFKNKLDFGVIVVRLDPDGDLKTVTITVAPDAKARRQPTRGGTTAHCTELAQVYEAAEAVAPEFRDWVDALAEEAGPGVVAKHAPGLKGRDRANKKRLDKYGGDAGLLYDIVRATLYCTTAGEATALLAAIEGDPRVVAVVKFKNRFKNPTANGACDFMIQLQLRFGGGRGGGGGGAGVEHICELQVHLKEVIDLKELSHSHKYYEFFRVFFHGDEAAVHARLGDLAKIIDARFFAEVVDYGTDSAEAMTCKLVAAVYASRDVGRVAALAELFEKYVQELALALLLSRRALALTVAAVGPDHADVGACYHKMARVLHRQGDYGGALGLYDKALAIRRSALGPDHADVAATYNNMAMVLKGQGDLGGALVLYEKSLAIELRALGPDHADVAATYGNMANVLESQGDYDGALVLHEKSLAIKLMVLGPDHADVAATYTNMAIVLKNQGDLDGALGLYEKSLAIQLRVLGPDHTDVATTYNYMANVLRSQGDLDGALGLHAKSLAIQLRVLGPDHASAGDTQFNMAELAEKRGDTARAWELFAEVHRVYTAAYGPEHGETLDAAQQLARLDE